MNRIKSFLIISIIISISVNQLFAQWSQWRGPNRNGVFNETNLLKEWPAGGPKRLWTSNVVGEGFASATVVNNTIYTTGRIDSSEFVFALDLNGNVLWQKEYGRAHTGEWPESRCTPTFYKDMLYVVSAKFDVACLNSKNGDILWKVPAAEKFEGAYDNIWAYCESPLVEDDKVILTPGGKQTTVVALNYLNGETVWKSECLADTNYYASPVLISNGKKKVIITCTRNHVLAVDLQTGKIIWKDKTGYVIIPTAHNKQFYVSGEETGGKLFEFNEELTEVKHLWNDSIITAAMGGNIFLGDKIYGLSDKASIGLFCVDIKTGKKIFNTNAAKDASIIATQNQLYTFENRTAKVTMFNLTDNNAVVGGSFKLTIGTGPGLAHLSVANGILFVRRNKVLIAYDIKQQ